ncbi:uncharacterized protein LOC123543363 [Mercenaria mercenaria]|uniref:uncharacterized protein LOC123543363 n=1 Tax=Mercenaria mercenaria TaxID=6596 RepID=UPI00234F57E8|nr:uncharacterized protein LOC123543363 [Mercenaria mercenaria]
MKERFGNIQEVVNLHYNTLINLAAPSNKTESLRLFLDSVEKHLRSLDVLKQDVNQDVFISMIKSKLPKDVLLQLELRRQTGSEWTVRQLRDCLCAYIVARERTDEDLKCEVQEKPKSHVFRGSFQSNDRKKFGQSRFRGVVGTNSAEVLVATNKSTAKDKGYSDKCRYCGKHHYSDECQKYSTMEERKQILKDSCHRCLKVGHMSKDCKRNKVCVHCGANNKHHRSLCPKKVPTRIRNEGVCQRNSRM